MRLKVIAYARNGHTDKFGIPRQSRDESPIETRIVFEPAYCVPEALRGIEGYSHLWLIWGFSENAEASDIPVEGSTQHEPSMFPAHTPDKHPMDWSPTVRPPRLGGNKRMGVFATRSPFRPNPIGLSSVRLLKVQSEKVPSTKESRLELVVSGADLMDGTPIYDIKPYLSFSDSHADARNGFAEEYKEYGLQVDWSLITGKWPDNGRETAGKWQDEVSYILRQDPRPAYQDDPNREYKMDYAGWCVTFFVQKGTIFVKKIEKITK